MTPDALQTWGEQLGRHAWPGFLVLLALLLAGSTALALGFDRLRARSLAREEPNPLWLLGGLAAGFALVLALAGLFSEIAEGLGDGRPMGRLDDALSRSIGLHTPRAVREGFALLTHLADPAVLTVLCVGVAIALWLARHRSFAVGWVAAVAGNAVLNLSLKQVFARARPVHDAQLATATGFSFPSGHSSGAVVCYGMLAYLAWRLLPARWQLPATLLAVTVIFATACSRIFLQVHYASDVAAGLCSGLAWLGVCIGSTEWARSRMAAGRRR